MPPASRESSRWRRRPDGDSRRRRMPRRSSRAWCVNSTESLEALIGSLERRRPTRTELVSFPRAYREAVAELAEARARGIPAEERARLEALVLRAHGLLYAPAVARVTRSFGALLRLF